MRIKCYLTTLLSNKTWLPSNKLPSNKCYLTLLLVLCLLASLYLLAPDYIRHMIVISPVNYPTSQKISLTTDIDTHSTVEGVSCCHGNTTCCDGNSTCCDGNSTCCESGNDNCCHGNICSEGKRYNLVFVKTHKTGTSTTVNILYNFGIVNGLNYAVYPYTHQLYAIQASKLMKLAANATYNIMCQHMVFNQEVIESVMPEDSYYFSLLREPTRAFISFYIFYNKDRKTQNEARRKLSLDASINLYLDGINKKYRIESSTERFPISNSINSMSYDLGMSAASSTVISHRDAEEYIKKLDARFSLIMTLEHLDESLALLRADLCWNNSDVFYLNRMQSLSNRSHETVLDTTLSRLKLYLTPDYLLYSHFNRKLEARIAEQPPHFLEELAAFRELRKQFEEDCLDLSRYVKSAYKTQQHPLSEEGNKSLHCNVLSARDTYLTKLISLLQDPAAARKRKEERYGFSNQFRDLETFPRQWKLKQL